MRIFLYIFLVPNIFLRDAHCVVLLRESSPNLLLQLLMLSRALGRAHARLILNIAYRQRTAIRSKSIKSWFKPKLPSLKQKNHRPRPQTVIVEEDFEDKNSPALLLLNDLKHYLRTSETSPSLRASILTSNLSAFIHQYPDQLAQKSVLPTINNVFLLLNQINGGDLQKVLPEEDLVTLFKATAKSLLAADSYSLPQFMVVMARGFIRSAIHTPSEVYAIVVDLGASLKFSGFGDAVSLVVKNTNGQLPQDFLKVILSYFDEKSRLELKNFEDIVAIASHQNTPSLLNDDLVSFLIKYVEEIFENSPPNVHEYEDHNKNVYRIQQLAEAIIHLPQSFVSIDSQLKLLKFYSELNYVVESRNYYQTIDKSIEKILASGYEGVSTALLKQDLFDDSATENFLYHLANFKDDSLKSGIYELVIADDIRSSNILRMQARLLQLYKELETESEESIFEASKLIYSDILDTESPEIVHQKVTEAAMLANQISPTGTFVTLLNEHFVQEYNQEQNYLSLLARLERALRDKDFEQALQVFDESFVYVHWDSVQAPKVQLALNKLVCLVAEQNEDLITAFATFRNVKQHMTSQSSAEALTAMIPKMLAEECVGDVIEMLKRELPTIGTESANQLPTQPPYAYAHKALYDTLQDFVLNYTKEDTFETNWVLYGELHKYFQIPFDSYLPTMKFFCEKNRYNAALVVFRRVKMQNEKHGNHNNPPPLREMYMHLLKSFGDQLYEDGVIEMHEYLNMDLNLPDTDIELQNCILDAYSNLQNVGKARDLFLAISSNTKDRGGINEDTIRIMIKTYTYTDMSYVQKFWNNLSLLGVFPNYDIFKQYLIAHVYHGCVEDAFQLIEEIDDYNLEFSLDLLLAMHNYCLDSGKQKEVVDWAVENHKEHWEEIANSGLLRKASEYAPETHLLASGENE